MQVRGGLVDVAPHDVFYDDTRQLVVLRCRDRSGRGVLSLHSSRARALSAYVEPRRASVEHRSERHHRGCAGPLAQRHAGVRRPLRARRAVRCRLRRVERTSRGLEGALHACGSTRRPVSSRWWRRLPVAERTVVEVSLERFDPRWGEDFGWQRVDNALVTQRVPAGGNARACAAVTLQSLFGSAAGAVDHAKATTAVSRQTQLAQSHITDRLVALEHALGGRCRTARRRLRAIDSSSPSTRNTWSTTPDPTTRRRHRKGDESSSSSTWSFGEARAFARLPGGARDLQGTDWSRITVSSRPTVDTKYPRTQKLCPTKLRLRSPYTCARWIALFPLIYPTTCDAAYSIIA